MKIGIALSKPPAYSETFFNSKIKGLLSSGNKVILFVQKNDTNFKDCKVSVSPKVYRNKGFQFLNNVVVFVCLLPYLNRVFRYIKLEQKTKRKPSQILKNIYTNSHLLKTKVDWVHFGFATLALQSENIAEVIKAKMAISCRGFDMDVYPLKHPNCYELLWQKVDKVHLISNYMLEKAIENGMPLDKPYKIITPAVDLSIFFKTDNLKPINNNLIKITTVARLHWIKGLDLILKAIAQLKKENINFNYRIIGSGKEYEFLSFLINQLDLLDCVTLVGDLPHTEVIKELRETDIYIQYSHSEGFCNAVLEAQAIGCLCVVSDGGALPENVIHHKTGFVVTKNNPKALASTLTEVLQTESSFLNKIRREAQNRVKEEFSLENQKIAFNKFYS